MRHLLAHVWPIPHAAIGIMAVVSSIAVLRAAHDLPPRTATAAQLTTDIEILAEHGGEVAAVAADERHVYAALGSRLVVLPSPVTAPGATAEEPWAPRSIAAPEGPRLRALAATGDGLVVATTEGARGLLLVYAIDPDGTARRVGQLALHAPAGPLVARGRDAWVGTGETLRHVDLDDPYRPVMREVFTAEREIAHLALAGSVLLTATEAVTGPPRPMGSQLIALATAADGSVSALEQEARPGEVTALAADDRWLAVIENDGILELYQHDDGRQRRLRSQRDGRSAPVLADPSSARLHIAFGADRLWLARPGRLLTALEPAAEPGGPSPSAPLDDAEITALATAPDGSPLLALGTAGLIHEPWTPGLARRPAALHTGRWLDLVADEGDPGTAWAIRAGAAGTDEGAEDPAQLHRVRIADTQPVVSLARAESIGHDGRWLYATADARLWRWDLADPTAPTGPLDLGGIPLHRRGSGEDRIAGATAGRVQMTRELWAIDVAGGVETHTTAFDIYTPGALTAHHAWGVVNGPRRGMLTLQAFDAQATRHVDPGLRLAGAGQAAALDVTGDLAVMAGTSPTGSREELMVLSVVDPGTPRILGVADLSVPSSSAIALAPPVAWLGQGTADGHRVSAFDLRLPHLPDELGQVPIGTRAVALDAVGETAWLVTEDGRVLALRAGLVAGGASSTPAGRAPTASATPRAGGSPTPSKTGTAVATGAAATPSGTRTALSTSTPDAESTAVARARSVYLPRCLR